MARPDAVYQFERNKFKVWPRQKNKVLHRKQTGNGMVCECDDHTKVGPDCCHIKIIRHYDYW